jgi:hypothetical protein
MQNIGFDWGLTFMDSKLSYTDRIRGEISSSDGDYSTNSLSSFSFRSSTGIKSEFYFLNNMFGLSAGIKYSRTYGYAGKWGLWSRGVNYFFWLYSQEGVNTEYLKVKRIYQISDYIGLPMEIRFFPARRPHRFQIYLKTGTEINYRVRTQTNIVFWDETMNPYEKELASQVEKPGHIGFSIYQSFGFRIGKDVNHSFSVEAFLRRFNLTSGSSGLLKTSYGGGIQFQVQIPIQSKEQ